VSVLPVRRISREEIDGFLWEERLYRRAARGEVMALAAVTGIDPMHLAALDEVVLAGELAAVRARRRP
jgi:hypothetical protein